MNSIIIICLFFTFAAIVDPGSDQVIVNDLSHYLPDSNLVNGWEPVYPPQTFVGDNLYDYIDGGASIYYEYGFKQVITQQYVKSDSQYLTLELYEMKNGASAYGMYTYKTGTSGKTVDIGTHGSLENHYLNFWKGRFLGTVMAPGSDHKYEEMLFSIARAVVEKITDEAPRPYLTGLLPADSFLISIGYVRGSLGLSRFYTFGGDDLFEIKEGVIGNYGNHQIFIFKYGDIKHCLKVFQKVQQHFRNMPEYSDHVAYEGAFSILDDQKHRIHCAVHEQYLFVCVSTEGCDPAGLFDIIRKNIK